MKSDHQSNVQGIVQNQLIISQWIQNIQ